MCPHYICVLWRTCGGCANCWLRRRMCSHTTMYYVCVLTIYVSSGARAAAARTARSAAECVFILLYVSSLYMCPQAHLRRLRELLAPPQNVFSYYYMCPHYICVSSGARAAAARTACSAADDPSICRFRSLALTGIIHVSIRQHMSAYAADDTSLCRLRHLALTCICSHTSILDTTGRGRARGLLVCIYRHTTI
jgi:hypothetical protein